MSEFKRLKRAAKSYLPRFDWRKEDPYTHEDARHMINDLGMQMSAEVLDLLVEKDDVLDDFLQGIASLEGEIKGPVLTEFGFIDAELEPSVLVEGQRVSFFIRHKKEALIFAEYTLEELPPAAAIDVPISED
ncbi:MAG: hypothetical protein AAF399_21020 [Bacteroidota bacterium]